MGAPAPQRASDGRLFVHGAMTDVTARKEAEGQLGEALEEARRSYAELSALHDQMRRVVGSIDELFYKDELRADGAWHSTWIGENWRRFIGDVESGQDPQEIWDDAVHPDDRERYHAVEGAHPRPRGRRRRVPPGRSRRRDPLGLGAHAPERPASRRHPRGRRRRAGHHGAQALGGAPRGGARARRAGASRGRPREPHRSADGSRQPAPLRGAARHCARHDASGTGPRAAAAGHRPLQAHERHLRSRGRRCGAARGRPAARRSPALATSSRASAARSLPS